MKLTFECKRFLKDYTLTHFVPLLAVHAYEVCINIYAVCSAYLICSMDFL